MKKNGQGWRRHLIRLPGWIASWLMILFTLVWTFWGAAEMYHEGWWGAWTNRLPYLVPIAVTLLPTLIAFRCPRLGGGLILGIGLFAVFFFGGGVAWISLAISLVGFGFIVEGMLQRCFPREIHLAELPWWRRRWRSALVLGAAITVFLGVSAVMLPIVLTRVDDGDRSARRIEGNGVALIWAAEGPGWNWQQPWGGYPSWQDIALYGLPPLGFERKTGYGLEGEGNRATFFANEADMARTNLCRYLDADGLQLMHQPQDIWRMPTTEELVRSLVRHGENAGCVWEGEFGSRVECQIRPDKESPLWSTESPAIYYWTAESYDEEQGYFVAYNGTVNAAYKLGGNPRHSYRCVREP